MSTNRIQEFKCPYIFWIKILYLKEFDLKGQIYTNKGITFYVKTQMVIISFKISFTKWEFIAHLQQMSTLFREMSTNQVCEVHSLSHDPTTFTLHPTQDTYIIRSISYIQSPMPYAFYALRLTSYFLRPASYGYVLSPTSPKTNVIPKTWVSNCCFSLGYSFQSHENGCSLLFIESH